jgi:outer membrane receptor for Fe3+-dicitrate
LRYERAGWYAAIGGTYVGESFADEANTALENADGNLGLNPSATLWDARIAKQHVLWNGRARIEGAVGATNLFDTDWHVHSRGGFFGGGKVAGPPRQIYASLDLTINL